MGGQEWYDIGKLLVAKYKSQLGLFHAIPDGLALFSLSLCEEMHFNLHLAELISTGEEIRIGGLEFEFDILQKESNS